jgi:glucosamine-6-phosphate deaminase
MRTSDKRIKQLRVGELKIEVYADRTAAAEAAADAAAHAILDLAQTRERFGVIFATGASQLAMLQALTATPNLPWRKVSGFHLDEYVGIDLDHPASFRRYLRKNLTEKITLKEFHELDGTKPDIQGQCEQYAAKLKAADPQLCLLGVGENGHLAFNDPAEADFNDSLDVKIVHLDEVCRQQQAAEGWFESSDDVPTQALTLTIPAILRVPQLVLSVPGRRKATIIRRMLDERISTQCPATILRTHPGAVMYLDVDSAAQLL